MARRTLWLSVLVLVGCGSQRTPVCGIGDTRACLGPGACEGAQVCLEDQSGFAACDCGDADDAGATVPRDAGSDDAGAPPGDDAGTPPDGGLDAGAVADAGSSPPDAGLDAGVPPTRLDLSVDQPTLSTEVGRTASVTVTLTASHDFAGHVTLDAVVFADAGVPDWSVTLGDAGLDVPLNGSASTTVEVAVPSDSNTTAAVLIVSLSGAAEAGTWSTRSLVQVDRRYTTELSVEGGACLYPPAGDVPVLVGTTLRWLNVGASDSFNIHTSGAGLGCPTQPTVESVAPGASYECVVTVPGSFTWYCHQPGPLTPGLGFTVE